MIQEKKFLIGNLKIVKGSAKIPLSSDNRVILFYGDLSGELKTSLALDLIKRWEKTKSEFRSWYRGQNNFKLGKTLTINVQTDTTLLSLLVLNNNEMDFSALKDALISAGRFASSNKYNIHLDKDQYWDKIKPMIDEYFLKSGVNVTVYEND